MKINPSIKLALIALAAALPLAAAKATLVGSAHDFSLATWASSSHGVCSICHDPHASDPNQLVPLWRHATTATVFTTYTSPSMAPSNVGVTISGASRACLSCHDGTLAINATLTSSGSSGTISQQPGVSAQSILGTDLSHNHPISITYDSSLVSRGMFDPTTATLQWGAGLVGQTIQAALLKGASHNMVECSSCHDPHRMAGDSALDSRMRRITQLDTNGRGSTLCRTCHNK